MHTTPKLSIRGLYIFDPTLFSGMVLPAGVDKDSLVENLCLELSGLEVIYPNADVMKRAISLWSVARLDSWTRIVEALNEQYNPLHNYDRHESYTDSESGTGSGTVSGSANSSSTTKEASYDSDSLVPTRSDEGSSGSSSTSSTTSSRSLTHTAHLYGNIGVTTSTQMLSDEINVRKAVDFDSIVIEEFKTRFCVMVY